MELHFLNVLLLVLSYTYSTFGDKVETVTDNEHFMGHRVTIPCKFISTNNDWMFLRWKRTVDGTTTNIASMQNNLFEEEWSKTAPNNFRDHVELEKRIADNEFSLDLVIEKFICTDAGVFTCEVFTMSSTTPLQANSTLKVKARPGIPTIKDNTIEVKENDTIQIECNSDVGVPARTISWLYTLREAPHIYQKVMEGVTQVKTQSGDCQNNARSTLSLEMTSKLDGATFICSTSENVGEDGRPAKSDIVSIVLYGKTTTTQSTSAPTTQKPVVTTETSSATVVSSPFSAVLLWCLVTVFNLFFARTT